MGYEAAEQAYGEHRFAEAQELLNEHLATEPDDPRALLLQAYIHFYGFQDTAAAANSYRQVLDLESQGPYRDLATEGLKHCPVSERQAKPAEPTFEHTDRTESEALAEQPPAAPWLAELKPQQPRQEQPKPEPVPEAEPEAPRVEPKTSVHYAMAEQAYQQRDFSSAQQLLETLLEQSPDDLRCLLLQGYVSSFGFHDETAAIHSYQRVLELEAEGPYRDLAIEGLSQCGVNLNATPAEAQTSEPDPAVDAMDLSSLAEAITEPETQEPASQSQEPKLIQPTKKASEQSLADGWLLVDLSQI